MSRRPQLRVEQDAWEALHNGAICWVEKKGFLEARDYAIPDLGEENWIFDHPCVVIKHFRDPLRGKIVDIAPVC